MPDNSTPAPTCAHCKLRYALEFCGFGFMGVYIPAKSRKCDDKNCPNHPSNSKG